MADIRASQIPAILGTAAISGVVAHQLVFKRLELDTRPVSTAAAFFGLYCLTFVILKLAGGNDSPLWLYSTSLLAYSAFLVSLAVNIFLYRAFFHALCRFPGPFGARLSKFWAIRSVVRSELKWYQVLEGLQAKYGDYVRTGPRELAVFDPAAISPILGALSKTSKGPWYGTLEQSLHTCRSKDFHKRRRKVWDVALKESLAEYTPLVEDFTGKLLARFRNNSGKPIVINDICVHYAYDVMSALAFGEPVGLITGECDASANKVLQDIREGIDAIGFLAHLPWLQALTTTFSWAIGPMRNWNRWSELQAEQRIKMKNPKPDIFGYLHKDTENSKAGRELLFADTRLIIGAGSDTTAIALAIIFLQMALYPEWYQKLRDEVDEAMKAPGYVCKRPLPMIDSFINESLRLYPPVFFGAQRETPPQGMTIGDTFIPGNTLVSIPPFTVQRDPRNFVRPLEFLPERWRTQPDLIINRNAFLAFNIGTYMCAGKGLAMVEMRSVVAHTVHKFDMHLPENVKGGFDMEKFFRQSTDHFTVGLPKIEVVFTERRK